MARVQKLCVGSWGATPSLVGAQNALKASPKHVEKGRSGSSIVELLTVEQEEALRMARFEQRDE